jgi:hypothetical protein
MSSLGGLSALLSRGKLKMTKHEDVQNRLKFAIQQAILNEGKT